MSEVWYLDAVFQIKVMHHYHEGINSLIQRLKYQWYLLLFEPIVAKDGLEVEIWCQNEYKGLNYELRIVHLKCFCHKNQNCWKELVLQSKTDIVLLFLVQLLPVLFEYWIYYIFFVHMEVVENHNNWIHQIQFDMHCEFVVIYYQRKLYYEDVYHIKGRYWRKCVCCVF